MNHQPYPEQFVAADWTDIVMACGWHPTQPVSKQEKAALVLMRKHEFENQVRRELELYRRLKR